MTDDQPFGVLHRRLHVRWQDARSRRTDDGIDRRMFVDFRQHLVLQVEPFRHAFLNEVGTGNGLFDRLGKCQLAFLRQTARHHCLIGAA